MTDFRGFRALVALTSLSTFAVSLCLPAIHAGGMSIQGSQLLFMGWLGILYSGVIPWIANPLYALAVLMFVFGQYRWATITGVAALLVALDSLRLDTWRVDDKPVPIDHYGVSFYLWQASFLILAIGAFVAWRRKQATRTADAA